MGFNLINMDIIKKMQELKANGSKLFSLECKEGKWNFGAHYSSGVACSKHYDTPEEAVEEVLEKMKPKTFEECYNEEKRNDDLEHLLNTRWVAAIKMINQLADTTRRQQQEINQLKSNYERITNDSD